MTERLDFSINFLKTTFNSYNIIPATANNAVL